MGASYEEVGFGDVARRWWHGGELLECHDIGLVRGEPTDVLAIPICGDGIPGGYIHRSPFWLCLGAHRYVGYVFCILSIYVLMCFFSDTDIILVTCPDFGEVGLPISRLVGVNPDR